MRYLTLLVSLCAFLFASFPAAAGVDVVIAAGGTESSVIDIHTIAAGGGAFLAIYTPSAWTTAGLSFKVSPNGRNRWSPAYDVKGTEYTVTIGTTRFIALDPAYFMGARYLKLVSGTNGAPVTQSASRTFYVEYGRF